MDAAQQRKNSDAYCGIDPSLGVRGEYRCGCIEGEEARESGQDADFLRGESRRREAIARPRRAMACRTCYLSSRKADQLK